MQVFSINNFNNKKSSDPSFKQILPEHLFINAKGYDKDLSWALESIDTIGKAKQKIAKKVDFNTLINFIADNYSQAIKNYEGGFGQPRDSVTTTGIFGRYNIYKDSMRNLVRERGTKDYTDYTNFSYSNKVYTFRYLLPDTKKTIGLSTIHMNNTIGYDRISYVTNLELSAPPIEMIKPAIKEAQSIYEKLFLNYQKATSDNLKEITKGIAEIHWLMSQARPYKRGSAGISDLLAKTLFESKGIQVSKYQENLDPNMEAFIMPVEEYVEKYGNFFTKPLQINNQ